MKSGQQSRYTSPNSFAPTLKPSLLKLALVSAAVFAAAGCRCDQRSTKQVALTPAVDGSAEPAPPDVHAHARDGVLVVRSLELKDVSATGTRLDGLVEKLRKVLDAPGEGAVRVREERESPLGLDLEVANVCERSGCYVAVKANARLRGEEGLDHAFSAVRVSPIDGLKAEPPLRSAGPAALRAVAQWLRALASPAAEIAPLLRSDDDGELQIGLQVVLDRGLAELAPSVGALIDHEDKEVRIQAIATAAALEARDAVPALELAARGLDPEVAAAAVRALADLGGEAARAALEKLAEEAPLATIKELSKKSLLQ
jgi:hypothetical protein